MMDQETLSSLEQSCRTRNMRTKREYGLGVLFFGGLLGISEAILGDGLYRAGVPHASVPLTVIGFVILTFGGAYFPGAGTATLIASCGMLYKFLNTPFFACHLLGIFLMGVCYDVFFSVFQIRGKWLAAGLAAYGDYAAFALMITYVARYEHWTREGPAKIFEHVAVDGSVAAVACAVLVPLSLKLGGRLKAVAPAPFDWRASWIPRGITGTTAGLWAFGIAMYLLHHAPRG